MVLLQSFPKNQFYTKIDFLENFATEPKKACTGFYSLYMPFLL